MSSAVRSVAASIPRYKTRYVNVQTVSTCPLNMLQFLGIWFVFKLSLAAGLRLTPVSASQYVQFANSVFCSETGGFSLWKFWRPRTAKSMRSSGHSSTYKVILQTVSYFVKPSNIFFSYRRVSGDSVSHWAPCDEFSSSTGIDMLITVRPSEI